MCCTLTELESIQSLLTNLGGGRWQCLACGYESKSNNVKYHIEAKHVTTESYTCPHCHEVIRNRSAYNNHMSRKHRDVNMFKQIQVQ